MSGFDFCISCFHQINGAEKCPYCGKKQYGFKLLPFQLQPNTILNDRYIIGEILGFGGFGITYKAYDITLNQTIAIKEYYPAGLANRSLDSPKVNVLRDDEFAKGKTIFIEEAKRSSVFFGSKNIVNVYDFFEANNTAYIKMEYLDGISLKDFISQGTGIVDVPTAVNITNDILTGVSELHKNGYIHCDLSPDNIMITTDNRIVIIDLGAAKHNNKENNINDDKVLKIGYAPPEQYQEDSALGNYTDIYAVGAILYRMLTGKIPEESNDRAEKDNLEEPKTINPKVPLNINNVCMRALALNSSLRLQSAEQFKLGLQGKMFKTEKQEKKARKIKMFSTVAAVLTVVIISVILGFVYRGANNTIKLDKYIKEDASVSIWIPYNEDEYEQTKELYDELFRDFEEEITSDKSLSSKITVDVRYIETSKYNKTYQAQTASEKPNIFVGSICPYSFEKADLSWIAEKVVKNNYLYNYKKDVTFTNLPVCFDSKAIYINRKYDPDGKSLTMKTENGISELDNAVSEEYGLSASNTKSFSDSVSLDRFLKGDAFIYCGKISDWSKIRKSVSWVSMIAPFDGEYSFEYPYYWSVRDTGDTDYASMYVLSYLLSDSAQELMCIENDSYAPLNKNILDVYINETHMKDKLSYLAEIE